MQLTTPLTESNALQALSVLDMPHAVLTFLSATNNTVYRVDDGDRTCALRIHRPGLKRPEWIDSELVWLRAIRAETTLSVPLPLADRLTLQDGTHAVLFAWLDGAPVLPDALSLAQVRQVGVFAAKLHTHSQTFAPPQGFTRPRLDWEGLFGENSPYNPGDGAALFTAAQIALMREVTEVVRTVMQQQGASADDFGLIHADLIFKNTLYDAHRRISVIDFDDCGFGFYAYEVACAQYFYRSDPRYVALRAALWDGYASVRPLPPHIDTFLAARHVASIRWVAGNPALRDRAPEIIAARMDDLHRFLNTGSL